MRDEWMKEVNAEEAEMEQRLTRALEARPAVEIPADFAARVAGQLPERRPIELTPTYYGRKMMVVCMVVLGVALLIAFVLHGVAVPAVVQVTGWILYGQFLGLVVWFGMRGELRRLGQASFRDERVD
jgi:Flp pilus assembly protein TadB